MSGTKFYGVWTKSGLVVNAVSIIEQKTVPEAVLIKFDGGHCEYVQPSLLFESRTAVIDHAVKIKDQQRQAFYERMTQLDDEIAVLVAQKAKLEPEPL